MVQFCNVLTKFSFETSQNRNLQAFFFFENFQVYFFLNDFFRFSQKSYSKQIATEKLSLKQSCTALNSQENVRYSQSSG